MVVPRTTTRKEGGREKETIRVRHALSPPSPSSLIAGNEIGQLLGIRFSPIAPLPSQLLEKEVYTVQARRATRGGDIGVNGGLSAGILLARVCVIDPGGNCGSAQDIWKKRSLRLSNPPFPRIETRKNGALSSEGKGDLTSFERVWVVCITFRGEGEKGGGRG